MAGRSLDHDTATIVLVAWDDSHPAAHSFAGSDLYFEVVYAGFLGPSAVLIYRRLYRYLEESPAPLGVNLGDLGRSFGLKPAVVLRTLERLVAFGFARPDGTELALRTRIPELPPHLVGRLSASARRFHTEALSSPIGAGR